MLLSTAAGIGLVGTLALHAGPGIAELVARVLRWELLILIVAGAECQTEPREPWAIPVCYSRDLMRAIGRFGLSPTFSTGVENTVENKPKLMVLGQKRRFSAVSDEAKVV